VFVAVTTIALGVGLGVGLGGSEDSSSSSSSGSDGGGSGQAGSITVFGASLPQPCEELATSETAWGQEWELYLVALLRDRSVYQRAPTEPPGPLRLCPCRCSGLLVGGQHHALRSGAGADGGDVSVQHRRRASYRVFG
jgi:hypothetical protein